MALDPLANAPRLAEIVLTGGPCSGKTSALSYLQEKLSDYGFRVFVAPEVATMLITGGLHDLGAIAAADPARYYETQREFVLLRRSLRERFRALAEAFPDQHCVIIHDRGEMDTAAYMEPAMWRTLTEELRLNHYDVRDSYAGVIHLVTIAADKPDLYSLENNKARQESVADAVVADKRTLHSWLGHPRLRIIDNREDFQGKLRKTLEATLSFLSVPAPLEIERKYLLAAEPDLSHPVIAAAAPIEIEQTYLLSTDPQREIRVRKRSQGSHTVYYRTEKVEISPGVRQEKEAIISASDYMRLLSSRDPAREPIHKTRYCFPYSSGYFELDCFKTPVELSLLEIELIESGIVPELPPFLEIDREVTDDPAFRNAHLALLG